MDKITLLTHDYDNKLQNHVKYILNKYPVQLTFFDSINQIIKINNEINNQDKIFVEHTLKLFTDDKINNHDTTNNVSVEQLLVRLIPLINKETDLKILFLEQLADIYRFGSCSQGRCTRLIQLFFIDTEI